MITTKKIKSTTITLSKYSGILFFLFLLYTSFCLIHGSLTDYVPEGISNISIEEPTTTKIIKDSTLTFFSWNLGYGGLGKESNFFYQGGGFFLSGNRMVRSPEEYVQKNIAGIQKTIKDTKADFYLLQEVDYYSKRSYFINQKELLQKTLPSYGVTTAINFDVNRVPTPILEPWNVYGEANSGLNTFSLYAPSKAERHQLPGVFSWPNRIFLLDRCLALHRFPTAWGKELIVINVHNSAFDREGTIKRQQMEYLKRICLQEFEVGNYVVVGGDWNQCPPGFEVNTFRPEVKISYNPKGIPADYMPAGWQWVYDPSTPTIRDNRTIYQAEKTFVTLIDFYLVSPNVEIEEIEGIDQGFDFSDHQAVLLEARLN